jgi:hypothetical protein
MGETKYYIIQPQEKGEGFTLTGPNHPVRAGFKTKEEALKMVESLIGVAAYKKATISKRSDGGAEVAVHEP